MAALSRFIWPTALINWQAWTSIATVQCPFNRICTVVNFGFSAIGKILWIEVELYS